jgi:hypothetical protein
MRINRSLAFVALIAVAAAAASAQQRPPIRQLGATSAKSTEVLGGVQGVRQLPDGRVLVNDVPKRRVLLFDPALSAFTVIADSTSATANAYSGRIGGLIPYKGDSSIFIDPIALSMLVLDGTGKVARVMSVPRSQDAITMAAGGTAIDPMGRLIYRAPPNFGRPNIGPGGTFTPPDIPDSAAILRIDLATRQLDTLGWIKTQKIKFDIQRDDNGMRITSQTNPLPTVDDWAVLNDGTVAIVRGHDYHVDFVGADGKMVSATKIPFDWQRLTDEDKVAFLDSLKAVRARMGANAPNVGFGGAGGLGGGGGAQIVIAGSAGPGGGGGPPPGGAAGGTGNVRIGGPGGQNANLQTNFVPASELPDYKPPFFLGNTRADNDGNLWIRTIPTKAIPGGPVYDVINHKGEIVERVQIPENRTIVGFGSDGTVYLANRVDTSIYLEKARVR